MRWRGSSFVAGLVACNALNGSGDLSIGETGSPGVATVSATSVEFGDAPCDTDTADRTITIAETGGTVADWAVEIPPGSPFSVVGPSTGRLDARASVDVRLRARPASPGPIESEILITAGGFATNVRVRVSGRGATVEPRPTIVAFGEVRAQSGGTSAMAIHNGGTDPLVIEGFEGGGSDFSIGWGDQQVLTVPAGQDAAVTVRLSPGNAESGTLSAIFTPRVVGAICGDRTPVVATGRRVPLDVTLSSLDFGTVDCGASPSRDVVITNYTSQPISWNASLGGQSAIELAGGATGSLGAGSSSAPTVGLIGLRLKATAPLGSVTDQLEVAIAGVAPPSGGTRALPIQAMVSGAVLDIAPLSITDFQAQKSGPPDARALTIKNTGNASVSLTWALQRTAGDPAWYLSGFPATLAGGASGKGSVVFMPNGACPCATTLTASRTGGAALCRPAPTFTGQGTTGFY